MAITFPGRRGTATRASTSITVNSVAGSSLLFAQVVCWKYSETDDTDLVTGVTSGGGTYVWERAVVSKHRVVGGSEHKVEVSVWFLKNAPSGNTTAVLAHRGDDYWWNWEEAVGCATTTPTGPTGTVANNAVTSVTTSSTGTLPMADMLVVGVYANPYGSTFTGPAGSTTRDSMNGAADPAVIGGVFSVQIVSATTAIAWNYTSGSTATQGVVAAVATFKGATTQRRLKINNLQSAVNGTTDWTIRYWAVDGATFTGTRVTGINAEASGGTIYVTAAQSAPIAALAPATAVNCVALRASGSPIKGLVGVVQGVIEDYT